MGDEILGSLGQGAPILQAFCQTGEYYREKGDLEKAEAQLREALQLESDHLAARLLLASIFVDHERLDEGIQELEEACRIDEQAARPPMVKALLKKGENLDQAGQDERALHIYERVLRLSPGDGTAHQRIAAIWEKRAAEALQAEDLDLAISAYERAGLADEVAQVKTERRRRAIEQAAAVAQVHEQREDWQEACAGYRWLIDEDAQNQSWPLALNRAALEIKLQDRYAKAADALQRSEWASAIDLLIEVLTVRPDYKDSASRLAEAVNKTRKGEEKSDAVPQTPSDEAREESSEEQAAELPKTSGPLRASWLLAGAVVAFLCALILGHFLTSPMTDAIALVESTPSSRVPDTSPPGTLNTKAEQSLAFVAEERVLPAENALSTTHAAGRNRPTTGAAHPDIWLVEADGPIELYSNGLQIRNEYLTHTGPRFYPVLERDVSGNHHTHRWGDRPVGIVLHSTESDLAAFSRANNELIRAQGRKLLLFIRRKTLYNFTIDRFGRVYRIVPETEYVNHAGNSMWADGGDLYLQLNHSFIGVAFEVAATTRSPNQQLQIELTPGQRAVGRLLIEMLRHRFGIAESNIVAHEMVSVNPGESLIGNHLHWRGRLPFEELGLPDNYERTIPSVAEWGFRYDARFARDLAGRVWPGLARSETQFRQEAAAHRLSPARYRSRLQARYRQLRRSVRRSLADAG